MERPTTKIELPITKKEVIMKEWLTGREYEEMQKPIFTALQKDEKGIDLLAMNHNAIKSYVVSVGGIAKDVLEVILDLPYDDYDFIIKKINELKKKV
jgi:hypothetical protein